ncbi:MAG: 16S rRNA (cytidine(1402)-2'-O)-methyltransferase [Acidobacteriota bacterium]|nr:16S rRNA (cytidine(1402)-2'-O)-methyltransferase [Acidobacteriota bacterium]
MTGKLLVVATPIGNLEDLTPRARQALEEADLVACEDTRRTGWLLHQLGLKRPLLSLHEHNERRRLPRVIRALEDGQTVVVASDAGTPLVSDPGFVLVREAAARQIPVTALPGASAVLVALVVSGLPPFPFTFCGFPPPKGGKRRTFFRRFAELDHTLIFFEAPHRLLASLEDAAEIFGERPAAVCRELTKIHEEVLRGSLQELHDGLAERPSIKGEIVVVVGPPEKPSRKESSGREDGEAAEEETETAGSRKNRRPQRKRGAGRRRKRST